MQQVASSFGETRQAIRHLIELVPQNQYYKVSWLGRYWCSIHADIVQTYFPLVEWYMEHDYTENRIRHRIYALSWNGKTDYEGAGCWCFGRYVYGRYVFCFLCSFTDSISHTISVPQSENHRFKLATEEYLHALVSLVNELSRLAVNSVTLGDFGTPVRLSAFVKDLHTGFQMLNLKNDSLRKRFDSIKVGSIIIQKNIRKVHLKVQ